MKSGKIPLIFGIVGHRDLDPRDVPELKRCVREVLLEYRRLYPNTPFLMLCALAEGADSLAAEVALEPEIGCTLHACLPRNADDYADDFHDTVARETFRSLLHAAWSVQVAYSENGGIHSGTDGYFAAGNHIVNRSHIFIALWDGHETNHTAGTAAMVRRRQRLLERQDEATVRLPLAYERTIHIVTPRRDRGRAAGKPFAMSRLGPEMLSPVNQQIYALGEEFNRDAIDRQDEKVAARVTRTPTALLPTQISDTAFPEADCIREAHAIADTTALKYQRSTLALLDIFVALAILAGIGFDLFSHLFHNWWHSEDVFLRTLVTALLLLSFTATGIAIPLHRRASRKALQAKFESYRALAEALRTQFYWTTCGIHRCVATNTASDVGLLPAFVLNAVSSIWLQADLKNLSGREKSHHEIEAIARFWIRDQLTYFETGYARARSQLCVHERLQTGLVGASVAAAVVASAVFCWNALRPFASSEHGLDLMSGSVFAAGLFPLLVAVIHFRAHTRAFADHLRQFDVMRQLYGHAAEELASRTAMVTPQRAHLHDVLVAVGRRAIVEALQWLVTHTSRPVRPASH